MRNVSADLLRIICCMLVIGIHSTPNYSLMIKINESHSIIYQSMFMKAIVSIGLPVFFIMSGYFLLNKKNGNLLPEYKKRITTLLIPFFIYSFINFLYFHYPLYQSDGVYGYFRLLTSSRVAISTHLWFIYFLLGIYLIYPALKVITDAIPQNKSIIAIVVIAMLCAWGQYEPQLNKLITFYKPLIPLPRIDVWVAYFVIGGLLARVKIGRKKVSQLFFLSLVIHFILTWLSVNRLGFDTRPFDSGIGMFFVSCMFTLFITGIEINNKSKISKIIVWVAPYTYGIYLMHMVILVFISKTFSINTVVDMVIAKTVIFMPLIFLLSFVATIAIDKLIVNRIIALVK
ncbi:TPA: acyltransferase [Escherichia coli]|nr:acyltransferase [Escherichia coli]